MAGRKKMLLTESQIEEVTRMAEKGVPIEIIGHIFNMTPKTFYERMKDQPGVRDAYEIGASKACSEVFETLWSIAKSGKNIAATIFYLKTRGSKLLNSVADEDDLDVDELKLALAQ